ncbi:uncharacterized protein Z520_01664 [Fonsecaea multimorphosa CBS 102226]|uniref:Isochorismatase-like domain-containing protein n=1 Tax=Fonsecaea multimorphosa CBS 102226 TaxID=1442371 RepID=A0A0D2J1D1_9EURO|nr:uncharacterized protein Z520_01664 [Fonsecaea multimorphosa CBS 102226]KIY03197.1 hypothetical protein Z520_01664 [Fonsecaea multimorphosa CBS 102226]OAL30439.1 hypothetical protein AYO22_01637 [Fonsecaea multimorphosa]
MSSQTTVNPASQHYLSAASEARTALLLIDIQRGLNTSHGFYGTERSTPSLEENVSAILAACRGYNSRTFESKGCNNPESSLASSSHQKATVCASTGATESNTPAPTTTPSKLPYPHTIEIIHIYHKSTNPLSPLHISGAAQKDGILFMPCAEPAAVSPASSHTSRPLESSSPTMNEHVLSKSTNTAFGNPELQTILQRGGIEQLVVCGIATDHCVTTSVRWARDLGVVQQTTRHGRRPIREGVEAREEDDAEAEDGKIVVLSDATACFNKGGFDAETVQQVHLASLEGEFAKVMTTRDVLDQLFG